MDCWDGSDEANCTNYIGVCGVGSPWEFLMAKLTMLMLVVVQVPQAVWPSSPEVVVVVMHQYTLLTLIGLGGLALCRHMYWCSSTPLLKIV
ncbi:hypothetical protein Pmani_004596 [Petrolisthes manimaculis]|uniref:Uncharacterized protein n=1 Tax=Petrolisthes manimaculis TaxID=1843537 RepID=A0AAE1QDE9_9EUCA|nr:hypothetical protein Pmani_004596 [Petrolisthes manimaculis]